MNDHSQVALDMQAEEFRRNHMSIALAGADTVQLRALWAPAEDLRKAKKEEAFSACILGLYFNIRDYVFSLAVPGNQDEERQRKHVANALAGADKVHLHALWVHAEDLRLAKDEDAFSAYVLELYFNIRDHVYDLPKVLLPGCDDTCISQASTVIH